MRSLATRVVLASGARGFESSSIHLVCTLGFESGCGYLIQATWQGWDFRSLPCLEVIVVSTIP